VRAPWVHADPTPWAQTVASASGTKAITESTAKPARIAVFMLNLTFPQSAHQARVNVVYQFS